MNLENKINYLISTIKDEKLKEFYKLKIKHLLDEHDDIELYNNEIRAESDIKLVKVSKVAEQLNLLEKTITKTIKTTIQQSDNKVVETKQTTLINPSKKQQHTQVTEYTDQRIIQMVKEEENNITKLSKSYMYNKENNILLVTLENEKQIMYVKKQISSNDELKTSDDFEKIKIEDKDITNIYHKELQKTEEIIGNTNDGIRTYK